MGMTGGHLARHGEILLHLGRHTPFCPFLVFSYIFCVLFFFFTLAFAFSGGRWSG